MFGTVTASLTGSTVHLSHWNVTVRSSTESNFNPSNSSILSYFNLGTTPTELFVTPDINGQYGQLIIGRRIGFDLMGAILADYSINPDGEAGFISPFTYQVTSPLDLNGMGNHVVATAVPEPGSLTALAIALLIRRRSKGKPE